MLGVLLLGGMDKQNTYLKIHFGFKELKEFYQRPGWCDGGMGTPTDLAKAHGKVEGLECSSCCHYYLKKIYFQSGKVSPAETRCETSKDKSPPLVTTLGC